MRYADGKVYLVDHAQMRVLVLDTAGRYLTSYDIAEKLGEAANRAQLGLRGFSVDREGNLLFTIQPLFQAYVMTPGGEVRAFGQRGSAPGKFNVVGGIARDDAGNFYVADMLKSAILVFSPEFRFVKEFGYRGRSPANLAAPYDIVVAGDMLFVSNRARRGVSVFRVGAKGRGEVAVERGSGAVR
jgi:DNA-binding beta-propeller fold protein YncE